VGKRSRPRKGAARGRGRLLVAAVAFLAFLGLVYWIATLVTAPGPSASPGPGLAQATSTACGGAIYDQPPKIDDAAVENAARRFCHTFYEVAYSTRLRDPLWSAEHLTKEMARASDDFGRPKASFVQQAELAGEEQGDTDDYVRSGYDRGHMTPANDAPNMESETDTFVVTNIVPQTKVLNERLWQYLEASVHEIAETDGQVYVVTGPIFEPDPPLVGGRIAIPVQTYKAIFIPARGVAVGFIASNDDNPGCVMVSIKALRERSGIDPFPALPDPVKAATPDFQLPHGVHIVHGEARQVPLPDCQAA
jgi:endonuclease G